MLIIRISMHVVYDTAKMKHFTLHLHPCIFYKTKGYSNSITHLTTVESWKASQHERNIKHWGGWITAAEDHIEFLSPKLNSWRLEEKKSAGLFSSLQLSSLDECVLMILVHMLC